MRWARKLAAISWCLNMLRILRFLLAALLLHQGAILAQTSTSAMPTPSTSIATSTTATKKPANSGEIYRWVDKNGKVQYSTDVPEDRRSTARIVDTRSNIVSSRVPASISGAPQAAPASNAPVTRQPVTEREKCEAAWKKFNEASSCFTNARQGTVRGRGNNAGGNIAGQTQEQCQSLTEPAPCR